MENRNLIIGTIIAVLLVAGGIWYFGYRDGGDARLTIAGEPQRVENVAQRLEFTYYGGPEGYTLLESFEDVDLGDPQLQKAYTIVDTDAYVANDESTAGIGDRIPAITILVFDEEEQATTTAAGTSTATSTPSGAQALVDWAEEHSGYTAYGLRRGELEEVRIDNVGGIRFSGSADGMLSETYVLEHRGKYYVIIGQYQDESDDIRAAFQKLLTEIYFL